MNRGENEKTKRRLDIGGGLVAYIVLACFFLLFPSLSFAKDSQLMQKSGEAVVGQPAPWLSGWTLDDQVFNLKKAFEDPAVTRVAFVFWATWCAPCKEGMKRLCSAKARLEAAGLSVVLINVEEQADAVKNYLRKTPLTFPVVLDPYGRAKTPYLDDGNGSLSLPRTVIVGRDGKVIRIIGSEGDDYIEQIIK